MKAEFKKEESNNSCKIKRISLKKALDSSVI
jgi:hypothetical protein